MITILGAGGAIGNEVAESGDSDGAFQIERANQIGSEGTIAACVPQTLAIRSLALSLRHSVE
jgi:hypothetical protein